MGMALFSKVLFIRIQGGLNLAYGYSMSKPILELNFLLTSFNLDSEHTEFYPNFIEFFLLKIQLLC